MGCKSFFLSLLPYFPLLEDGHLNRVHLDEMSRYGVCHHLFNSAMFLCFVNGEYLYDSRKILLFFLPIFATFPLCSPLTSSAVPINFAFSFSALSSPSTGLSTYDMLHRETNIGYYVRINWWGSPNKQKNTSLTAIIR